MREWTILDREDLADDDGTMYLVKRGTEFAIHVNGRELMADRHHGSEDALAELACDRLRSLDNVNILVGGLGIGFTLSAALRRVGESSTVTVAELLPAVVRWNREHIGAASKHPLRDARARVHVGDVADLIGKRHRWDAILLDVDNGPRALTRPYNGWLYTADGLRAARDALNPGGVLGVWSAANDAGLTRRLRKGGFDSELIRHVEPGRPTPDDSGTHFLWMAKRRD